MTRKRRSITTSPEIIETIAERTKMTFDLHTRLIQFLAENEKAQRKFRNVVLIRLAKIETMLTQVQGCQLANFWPPTAKITDEQTTGLTVQTFYRAAAMQTLAQAEALLTSYRSAENVRDPQAMQQAARWARDVLSSTRLLLDSPAGRDPQMRTLFTDLELILAQIVQLSGTPLQSRERELIDHAMRDRDLLPRIRSAVPSGLATS